MYHAELIGLTNFACYVGGLERNGIRIGGETRFFSRGRIYTVTDEEAELLRKQTDSAGAPYFKLTKISSEKEDIAAATEAEAKIEEAEAKTEEATEEKKPTVTIPKRKKFLIKHEG